MTRIDITGIEKALKRVKDVQKQIRFATVKAINRTALAVQKYEISKELPNHIRLRTAWWKPGNKFGVNIKFATKLDPKAKVESRAPWLAALDKGGTKRPQDSKTIAIPTNRINQDTRRRTRDLPPILIASKRAFSVSVNGHRGIFRRVGKRARKLEALYFYYKDPKIPDLVDFYESGQRIVNSVYADFFDEEFENAIRTAR